MHARSWRWATLVVALLAPLGAALATGLASLHRCVPVDGSWGALGLRLALLHPDAACPAGTMAVNGEQVLGVAVVVTAPGLALHAATALGVAGITGLVRAMLAAAARRMLPHLPARPRVVVDLPRALPAPPAWAPRSAWLRRAQLLRGPPGGPLGALAPS